MNLERKVNETLWISFDERLPKERQVIWITDGEGVVLVQFQPTNEIPTFCQTLLGQLLFTGKKRHWMSAAPEPPTEFTG